MGSHNEFTNIAATMARVWHGVQRCPVACLRFQMIAAFISHGGVSSAPTNGENGDVAMSNYGAFRWKVNRQGGETQSYCARVQCGRVHKRPQRPLLEKRVLRVLNSSPKCLQTAMAQY
jgi:hypothetical protein